MVSVFAVFLQLSISHRHQSCGRAIAAVALTRFSNKSKKLALKRPLSEVVQSIFCLLQFPLEPLFNTVE